MALLMLILRMITDTIGLILPECEEVASINIGAYSTPGV